MLVYSFDFSKFSNQFTFKMPRVASSAKNSLFVFLKRDRGLLTLNLKRKNHLLKIQVDELCQLTKLLFHYHIATGGTMQMLGDLDVLVENGINHWNDHVLKTHKLNQSFSELEINQ